MNLSYYCVLVYVLRDSGVGGRLTKGRIEIDENMSASIYDTFGRRNEYISGARLRSWGVFHREILLAEWSHILPEDAPRLEKLRWP